MKLSEMNTQQLAECLCKIAPALERIGMDEATNRAFAALSGKLDGGTRMQQLAQMVGALVPALLGTHFDDMVVIVAAMTGKTEDGVRAQNLLNGRPQHAFLHDGRNFRRGAYRRAGRHQMNSFFVNSVVHGGSSVSSAQSAFRRPRPAWRGSAEERARVKPFQWLPAAHTVAHGDIR